MEQQNTGKSQRSWLPIAIAGLAALTALYVVVITSFVHSGGAQRETFPPAGGAAVDRLQMEVNVLTIDPVMNSYKLRLKFTPEGSWAGAARGTLARPVTIVTNDVGGAKPQENPAGQLIPTKDVTLDALGETAHYPLDHHTFTLDVRAYDAAGAPVPIATTWISSVDDWKLAPRMSPTAATGDVILDIDAGRSTSVLIMAFGLMTVLGLLVVVNVAMVVRAIHLHKVEFTTLASLAATLFAIPGIRNGMPNTPPVGTLADFLVFFWALMIVGLCLVAATLAWLQAATAKPRE
ncbi:DUF4436 family protein [Catenulispora pinisilvae]|uniref:DUF4436 family protein n=1 Tax=Catenulispora pinisilvae TaxID=2705253 RepID=UPI001891543A|nr:DUF4436 family protein [Catenulispora pinisilvae]